MRAGRISDTLALCTVIYLYADWGRGLTEIFRGTIWTWEHSRIQDDAIILTCYDMLYYLQKSTDSKYYAAGQKTKAIISDILKSWNVPMGEYTAPDVSHQKILYKSKTVSAMLTETLDDAKKLGGGKAIIRANAGKADVVAVGGNGDIYGFTAYNNLTSSQDKYSMTSLVTRVIVTGKEDGNGRPKVEATIDGDTKYGILQSYVSMGSGSLADAKKRGPRAVGRKRQADKDDYFAGPRPSRHSKGRPRLHNTRPHDRLFLHQRYQPQRHNDDDEDGGRAL